MARFHQLKPPVSVAELVPASGTSRCGPLLLRAGVPSQVTLRGPRWLRFQSLTLHLLAGQLERNMAQPEWGTTHSVNGGRATFLLPGPTRLDRFGVWYRPDGTPIKQADFLIGTEEKSVVKGSPGRIDLWGTNRYDGYMQAQVALTDRVTVTLPHPKARVVLSSSSLPSRVSLGIGDDVPVQVLPVQLEPRKADPRHAPDSLPGLPETSSTRDLAGPLNAAWQKAAGQAGTAPEIEVPLRLTSATDGIVFIEVSGEWDLWFAEPASQHDLQPLGSTAAACRWPLPAQPAKFAVQVTGQFTGGVRLGLVESAEPRFVVRTNEQLEVAQAVLPAAVPDAREVAAVWLRLPGVPAAEQKLRLHLALPLAQGVGPSETSLATLEASLPVDAAAYALAGDGSVWHRVGFPKPVPLDGAVMTQPFFVVAAGSTAGIPLCHREGAGQGSTANWVPPPGKAGHALVRNRGRNGSWEAQVFGGAASQWLMDLELVPLPDEYGSLATMTVGGEAKTIPAGPDGQVNGVLEWNLAPVSSGHAVDLKVSTQAGLSLSLQPSLEQKVSPA